MPRTSNALTSNAQDRGPEHQERESRNKTLKITSRNEDQNAQETPKNNGQHALNSRSPLVIQGIYDSIRPWVRRGKSMANQTGIVPDIYPY